MEIGQVFLVILPPSRSSARRFVCMCVLSSYSLYVSGMLRYMGVGGQSTAEKAELRSKYLHPLYPKISASYYF